MLIEDRWAVKIQGQNRAFFAIAGMPEPMSDASMIVTFRQRKDARTFSRILREIAGLKARVVRVEIREVAQ